MEKYGIMREYECRCGMKIVTPNNVHPQELEKQGQLLSVEDHTHVWKESGDGQEKGRSVRPDEHK